jgi:hypothetical protein
MPEVKRLLGRLGLRWDDNIKMGFKEIRMVGRGLDFFGSEEKSVAGC